MEKDPIIGLFFSNFSCAFLWGGIMFFCFFSVCSVAGPRRGRNLERFLGNSRISEDKGFCCVCVCVFSGLPRCCCWPSRKQRKKRRKTQKLANGYLANAYFENPLKSTWNAASKEAKGGKGLDPSDKNRRPSNPLKNVRVSLHWNSQ